MWRNVTDVEVGTNVYIPHRNYQVKSFSWLSASCAARNHFLHLHKQNESYASKVKFRQASIYLKRVLEAAKLACVNKKKNLSLARNMTLVTFGKLLIVFSTKLIQLYLFYLTL